MMHLTKVINQGFRVTRKAKIYKKPILTGIPHYHKPNPVDIHDGYQFRPKQQVMQQVNDLQIQLKVIRHCYGQTDVRCDVKNRKAIVEFTIDQFNFTEWQYERFKVLMGARYKQSLKTGKIVSESFPDYHQNFEKATEQLKEVILQSKRAP